MTEDPKTHKQRLMDEVRTRIREIGGVPSDECLEVTDPISGESAWAMPAPDGWWVSAFEPRRWWPDKQAAIQGLARHLRRMQEEV